AALPALAAAVSLTIAEAESALLVAPWLLTAVVLAGHAGLVWLRESRQVRDLWWPVATAYLVVGAGWWLAHAAGLEPVGITEPFVELTAVHFHYAGLTATVYAALTWLHATVRRRTAAAGLVLVAAAPPFVAVGFTWVGWLQIVGAVLLTAGLLLVAWVVLREVVPAADDRLAAALLAISALAVIVPMLLAVQWAVGANLGTPALSVPDMARTHGLANALGFSLLGLLGWRRLAR
ncbi:MAG: YndJ family transporter, partial [Nitriliruptorales bacterium]